MKTRYLLSLIGILFLISCGDNPKKSNGDGSKPLNPIRLPYIINIEDNLNKEQVVSLSNIGKKLEYIPLETTPNSLMGEILHIELTPKYIFVAAYPSNGLLQFDRKGKFIKQIGSKGRGPGEYVDASRFCIDQKNERIFIMSCWSRCNVMEFNFDGEYIRSFDQPWESHNFLIYDTVGLVFEIADYSPTATRVIPGTRDYSFLENNISITDFECKPLFKIKRHLMRNSNYSPSGVAFYYFDNELRFQQFGVDTLYTLKNEKLEPNAIFNLGKSKMDPNLIFTQSNLDNMKKQLKNDISIRLILENQEFLFVKLALGLSDSSKLCVFNKKTSQVTFLKSNEFENDIDGGISFWPKYVYNDSILVDYENALQIKNSRQGDQSNKLTGESKKLNDEFINFKNNLTETSNPVIIILK